ncbi:MAG: 4-hydroxy-tetrahydrodipicolinate synthase [Bacteroidales bacterium]|nr:4-hydroxy-tetrahydrodipicolinate synthase [Bacteroidales bacterium]
MRNDRLFGVGVALVTPFKEDGAVDYAALTRLLEHIIGGGVHYIVVSGTTGEPSTMTASEKAELRAFIIKQVAGRVPLVLGIGGNNTAAVIDEIRSTDLSGFDSILSISPYYTKPNQHGIYAHFAAIAQASTLPIILYNVPGRTSRNIEPATIVSLANDFKNIVAVKEASGNMAQIMSIVENKPDDFMVISGDDALTVPMMSVGVSGVISVAANVAPEQCVRMVNAAAKGDFAEASRLHYQLLDLMGALFEDGSPAGAKAALKMLGITEGETLRLPLVPVCDAVREKIKTSLQKALKA